jgi:hypothetical protein
MCFFYLGPIGLRILTGYIHFFAVVIICAGESDGGVYNCKCEFEPTHQRVTLQCDGTTQEASYNSSNRRSKQVVG